MRTEIELTLSPEEAAKEEKFSVIAAEKLEIEHKDISAIKILRRSIDARGNTPRVNLKLLVVSNEVAPDFAGLARPIEYQNVENSPEVIVVGAGPAGLFAALRLIELGYKPIILERGKDVSSRKRDIASISTRHLINSESNYCFGEGGAGTFSDGKLYTRSKKRGNIQKILEIFYWHGADENILIDAHPHIGTNKLPRIIANMRKTIMEYGGEVYFNTKVTDFIIRERRAIGVVTQMGDQIFGNAVILATGHSARDVYELLYRRNIKLAAKGFAVGVRIEHPQELIDNIQYNCKGERSEYLPAASYNLNAQIEDRGVYSFCMCPGGFIVPAATAPGEIVVNGMSPAGRNSPFANSGMVVEIRPEDLKGYEEHGVMAGLRFQENIEKLAYLNGGRGQTAPAQGMHDFVKGKLSGILPEVSYHPGVASSPLHFWMPEIITKRLQKGFEIFGKKMHGYLTNEAVLVGVESRTSSPLKIPRIPETLEHIHIKGLFPCGEGAGYAGGIVSSAIDGERCAEKVTEIY